MKNIKLRKAEMISRQILLYFVDFHRIILPLFDKQNVYRIPFKAYDRFRLEDKDRFRQELSRLKRQGLINIYLKDKVKSVELTKKGKEKLKNHITENLEVMKPEKWDKKWRIVVFDIPNTKKAIRNLLREKLRTIGFIELQESVYVFPFDCFAEIDLIRNMYLIKPNVQYILADRVETEKNLIQTFIDLGILSEKNIT